MPHLSALIIDRDPESMEVITGFLKDVDIEQVFKAYDLKSGEVMISQHKPTVALLVIVSMKLSDKDNILAFVEGVKKRYPLTSIFITCVGKESDLILEVMRAGADDYLPKPINKAELIRAIEKGRGELVIPFVLPKILIIASACWARLGDWLTRFFRLEGEENSA